MNEIPQNIDGWVRFLREVIYSPSEFIVETYGSIAACVEDKIDDSERPSEAREEMRSALRLLLKEWTPLGGLDCATDSSFRHGLKLIHEFKPDTGFSKVIHILRNAHAIPERMRGDILVQAIAIAHSYFPSPPTGSDDRDCYRCLVEQLEQMVNHSDLNLEVRSFAAAILIANGSADTKGNIRVGDEILGSIVNNYQPMDAAMVHEWLRNVVPPGDLQRCVRRLSAVCAVGMKTASESDSDSTSEGKGPRPGKSPRISQDLIDNVIKSSVRLTRETLN